MLAGEAVSVDSTKVAVLLVAGAGTRLGDPAGRPKSLVDVGGVSMLRRAIDHLLAVGVEHFVLATGYREDLLREAVAEVPAEVSFCRNEDYLSTQNSVSLLRCADAVAGRAFFKLDGDVLFEREVLERLLATPGDIVTAVDRGATLADEEMKVRVDGDRVLAFGKHLDPKASHGESIGIERISETAAAPLFEALGRAAAEGRTSLYYEDVYDEMLREGTDVRFVDVTDLPWIEVDTREDLARAVELFGSSR
jgi:choline kinase